MRTAYSEKQNIIDNTLKPLGITRDKLKIYIRIFKKDKLIELWGKNISDENYKLITTFDVCRNSGTLGPKRKQRDRQVPEGFYQISVYNPWSNYYLSMLINYPNKSDRILGNKQALGGNICIHGACVTIGCIPITDEYIKELYIYCIEAKNNGQENIPVTIFPTKMTSDNVSTITQKYSPNAETKALWDELKQAYDYFNSKKVLPNISFLNTGRHKVF